MDDDLAKLVGDRVQRLRQESGLGLREQARLLGVSASSLSELENHRGGMSLRRLQVVAEHFGIHLTDLLRPVKDDAPQRGGAVEVINREDLHRTSIRRGHGSIYQVLGRGPGHEILPVLITFEPGGNYDKDQLSHPGEEFAYVILGDVELLYDRDCIRLGPGDTVRFRANKPHSYRNASSTNIARIIAATTAS